MKDQVVFVSMEGKKDIKIGNFSVREDIALPVLVDDEKSFSIEDITPQKIISGMIKVITENPDSEHIQYYKNFIFTIEPEIEARLTGIAYEAENSLCYEDALEIYKVLYSLNPDSLDNNLNIAVCYDEFSNYLYSQGIASDAEKFENQAFQFFKKVEEFEDKTESAYYYLGRFYLSRENFDKARDFFEEFLKITTDSERKDEVITLLKELKVEGINDPDYQNAVWLIQSEKEDEAVKSIDEFIKKYPKSWHGYYIKGFALRKAGDYNNALEFFNKALLLNPESPDVDNEMGLCYMNLSNFTKSGIFFSNALRKNPDDTAIIYNLALLSMKKGDKNEALRYCEVILTYNPKDLEAQKLAKLIKEN